MTYPAEKRVALAHASALRLGFSGYCRILAALQHPMTTQECVAKWGINHNTMTKLLRQMRHLKLIHRCLWVKPERRHARWVPVWKIGGEGDVARPVSEVAGFRPPNSTMILLATIIEVLSDDATTQADLAVELAMHVESASRYVRVMHGEGLIRIAGWHRTRGDHAARWAYGSGDDAKRPERARVTPAVRRKWRATHNANKARRMLVAALTGSTT